MSVWDLDMKGVCTYQREIPLSAEDQKREEYTGVAETKDTERNSKSLGRNPDNDMKENQRISRAPFDEMRQVREEHPCEYGQVLHSGIQSDTNNIRKKLTPMRKARAVPASAVKVSIVSVRLL
jgi:hypothetical protein